MGQKSAQEKEKENEYIVPEYNDPRKHTGIIYEWKERSVNPDRTSAVEQAQGTELCKPQTNNPEKFPLVLWIGNYDDIRLGKKMFKIQ